MATPSAEASSSSADAAAPPAPVRPRFEHYQTATHLTLSVFARDVDGARSELRVLPGGRALALRLAQPGGAEARLELQLHDAVDEAPAGLTASFRPAKVEVRLAKAESARYQWPSAEARPGAAAAAAAAAPALPAPPAVAAAAAAETAATRERASASASASAGEGAAGAAPAPASASEAAAGPAAAGGAAAAGPASYPTSSRKKKDWNAVEKAVVEEEAAEKPEGEEALYKLFRSIYAGGTEETRRAMNKSFQTSGGTVLSTNWGEVAKKDFEKEGIQPPEGMEVKKYEH
jgi:hypothetical protein